MNPTDPQLNELARLLAATADGEIDCAAVLDRVAAYLEARLASTPLEPPLAQVDQHLRVCPECHEEFIALLRAHGLDPAGLKPGPSGSG